MPASSTFAHASGTPPASGVPATSPASGASEASGVPAAPAARWARRKESRPGELIAAALEVFVERGYAATRLEDVAQRAGVSKGTLYLYFANKEELFKAVVRENIVPQLERFRASLLGSEDAAASLLERFFRVWWAGFGSTRLSGIAKLVVAEAGNFPEVARFFFDEVIHPNHALLELILERGMARGEFCAVDAPATAHVWTAALVMKAIACHSLESCCPADERISDDRFLEAHIALARAALGVSA